MGFGVVWALLFVKVLFGGLVVVWGCFVWVVGVVLLVWVVRVVFIWAGCLFYLLLGIVLDGIVGGWCCIWLTTCVL